MVVLLLCGLGVFPWGVVLAGCLLLVGGVCEFGCVCCGCRVGGFWFI